VMGYAVEEATGRFQTVGAPADEPRLRYRQPGPGTSAPVVPLGEAAGQADATVLQRFLAL
jgi:hypothetical protein